jgi:hypothetical protein
MRATEILFESRAAVLKAEAEAKLLEKQIELEVVKQAGAELALLREQNEQLMEQVNWLDAQLAKSEKLLRQALEALEACLGWPRVIGAIRAHLKGDE